MSKMEARRSRGAKDANTMQPGLYFRRETGEITTVRAGDAALPAGWAFIAPTLDAGLVAARALLVERGLVDPAAAGHVYWLMPPPVRDARPGRAAPGAAPA
jgi:hypothetical protein